MEGGVGQDDRRQSKLKERSDRLTVTRYAMRENRVSCLSGSSQTGTALRSEGNYNSPPFFDPLSTPTAAISIPDPSPSAEPW